MAMSDYIRGLNSLAVKAAFDAPALLGKINKNLGTAMVPREEGGDTHVTIITPVENRVIPQLSDQQIQKIASTGDFVVEGLGYINGETFPNLRSADKKKKVCFIALSSEKIADFRRSLGLDPKDLHLTLGFEGGDIFFHIVGEKPTGGKIYGPVPKRASDELGALEVPSISFSGLGGQEKE